MSKASQIAEYYRNKPKAEWRNESGNLVAMVNCNGCLEFPTRPGLSAAEALSLSKWLIETFSD